MTEDLATGPLAYRLADYISQSGLLSSDASSDAGLFAALQVLVLMGCLLIKHFICDFVFQTNWQAANKGRYGHPAGLIHTGQHVVGSAVVLFGLAPMLYASLLIAEALIHYHVDWAKDGMTRAAGLTPTQHMFWASLGFDQLAHNLTYVAMTGAVLLSL